MKPRKLLWIFLLCLIIVSITVIYIQFKEKNVTANAISTLSNKKIGWGVKRNPYHEQPDLENENIALLNHYGGIAMGNKYEKSIYLTFDEGYEAGYTSKILDILKEYDIKVTFFITSDYLNSQPELVQRMLDEGHIVGNHTVNHPSLPDLSDEEITKEIMDLHFAIYEKYGYEMKYIRPPMGEFSERTLNLTKELGYTTTMWSLAYDDWDQSKQGRIDYAKYTVISNIHNGSILLLHANSEDNSNILEDCIKQIKKMGYEFKTLDEFR